MPPRAAGSAALSLHLHRRQLGAGASAPDGRTIEQGLLPPGSSAATPPGEVGRVMLGKRTAVEVQQGGVAGRPGAVQPRERGALYAIL